MPLKVVISDVEIVYWERERPARRFYARAKGPDGYVELVMPERAAIRLQELMNAVAPGSVIPST